MKKVKQLATVAMVCLILLLGALGCTSGHPVPGEAFESCSESGGTPEYESNGNSTKFKCVP